jgi:hypothetical protein
VRFSEVPFPFVSWENYPEFKKLLVDSSTYPDDYDVYLDSVQRRQEAIRSAYRRPARVEIIPSDFRNWCARAGLPASTRSLNDYTQIRSADRRQQRDAGR